MGCDVSCGSIRKRAKHGLNILSIMTTWSLENAIETADSMKARGYGIPGRTAFSIFTLDKRDKYALSWMFLLGIYTLVGKFMGEIDFRYFPSMRAAELSVFGTSIFVSYLLLCICPIIIEIWEVRKWKLLESKM